MAIDHRARARRAWSILVGLASRRQRPVSYKSLCAVLGLHHRAATYFLGVIQTECGSNGWPPLQALVVNARTRLPGHGYYGSHRTHSAHRRALQKVYGKKWPLKAPF